MKLSPFSYFQLSVAAPLGVGLLSAVDTDDSTPLPPVGATYRAVTQGNVFRRTTQGPLRITVPLSLTAGE